MSTELAGLKWKCVVNGKKAANGARYSATFYGGIEEVPEGATVYEILREILDHVEMKNAEMELPDSIQITLA